MGAGHDLYAQLKGVDLATAGPKGSRFVVTVDGVEGPKFEEILSTASHLVYSYGYDGSLSGIGVSQPEQIAFSPDGDRYAYAGRNDKDVILILDGKEIYRAPFSPVVGAAILRRPLHARRQAPAVCRTHCRRSADFSAHDGRQADRSALQRRSVCLL